MCIQETRLHAICNHQVVDRIECSDKCAHFDTIEIQLSTYCQSCRQQVDNTAILNSVLRWKLGPCPARRRKIRPTKTNLLDGSQAPGSAPVKPSPRPPRKLSGAKSLSALREAASAPPTRELPPTPKRPSRSASVENLAVSLGSLGLASPVAHRPGPRYSLDVKPAPPTLPLRRRASEAFEHAAGGDGLAGLARAHTVPKSKARSAVPQRPTPRTPTFGTFRAEELKSPRPSLRRVPEELRPKSAVVAKDTDTDTTTDTRPSTAATTDTTTSTRPSTATTTSTMTTATSYTTSPRETRKSAVMHQSPSYPPPPPPQRQQQQQHQHQHQQQEAHQPQTVSSSVPRTLWSLRRSRSSARILALASTREYVHAKLCGSNGLPSPSAPGKNLFPAPQSQQKQKKPIDIHDPDWLARHGLKWDARGLGLISAAV